MQSDELSTWRNLSRHEETFHAHLYRQISKTPWWLISLTVHALLVIGLFQFDWAAGRVAEDASLLSSIDEPLLQALEEPPQKPKLDDMRPVEQDETDLVEPTLDETHPEDEENSTEDLGNSPEDGDPDLFGNSPFDGPSTNGWIGIGGGAGGMGPRGRGRGKMKVRGDGASLERALVAGLEWLRNHQSKGGYWDSDGFMAECKGTACDGSGHALYDPGLSGLALLAFLGAGETHKYGNYQATVRNGLRYLKQIQDPEGCFGPRTQKNHTYNHAIAALAMTEAYAMTGSPLFKRSAQLGIDYVHKAQNPYLAWRYGVRPGDNDTSVSGWMLMALKSARIAHLRVDENAFAGMRSWLEKATEPEYGRVGYTSRGSPPARTPDMMEKFPSDRSESLTAVGVMSRVFLGENPSKSELIQKGTDLCLRSLPVWDEASGSIDMYYWYYGTLAMFQVGGDAWKRWNTAMAPAILDNQRVSGCAKGSWDPIGPWGREGGRVYSTALMTMCMEVHYRYPKVFGTTR